MLFGLIFSILKKMGFKTFLILLISFCLHTHCQVEDTVIICKGPRSYSYHHHQCEGLGQCGSGTATVTLLKAKSMGRTPCDYCYGKRSDSKVEKMDSVKHIPFSKKPAISSSKCLAITKQGKRCKRKASPNGYCWQHGK